MHTHVNRYAHIYSCTHMLLCMYTNTYVCTHKFMCTYAYTMHVHIYVHYVHIQAIKARTHMSGHASMYIYACIHKYIHIHAYHAHSCMYTCIHMHIHIHIYTCTHNSSMPAWYLIWSFGLCFQSPLFLVIWKFLPLPDFPPQEWLFPLARCISPREEQFLLSNKTR